MKTTYRTARKSLALLLVIALLFSGCGEIPDISKFAEASSGMTTAIRKGVAQTDEVLEAASTEPAFDSETQGKLKKQRADFQAALKPTLNTLDKIDGYLDALQAIAQAHKKSAEQSAALVSAVGGVVKAASGLIIPAAATNIITAITTLYRKLELEKDFKQRVNMVSEIMEGKKDATGAVIQEGVIDLLKLNVKALKDINDGVSETMITAIIDRNAVITQYHNQILGNDQRVQRVLAGILEYKKLVTEFNDFSAKAVLARDLDIARLNNKYNRKFVGISDQTERRRLEKERDEKIEDVKKQADQEINSRNAEDREIITSQLKYLLGIDAGLAGLRDSLKKFDEEDRRADANSAVHRQALVIGALEQREAALLTQTKALTADMQRINPAYTEAVAYQNKARARHNALNALLIKSDSALDAWAETHARLRMTLNTKQPLTATRLLVVAREMLDIIKPEKEK